MLFTIPFPAIDPVLVEIGPLAIRWYALAYVAGIFLGWWYAKRLVGNPRLWGRAGAPMNARDIDDFVVWCALGIILGGRIGYVLFYDLPRFAANPMEILELWHGGMSFHGGFLGTMLAMLLFSHSRKIPFWSLVDVIAPSVTFGLFFGRCANFINGELFGRATDVPWAMVFPDGGPEPRHPSQLYEAGLEGIALFVFLRILTHRYHKLATRGFVSGAFAFGYGLSRFVVEFVRQPDEQFVSPGNPLGWAWHTDGWGLTMGQILSLPMILAGLAMMIWVSRRARTAGAAGA